MLYNGCLVRFYYYDVLVEISKLNTNSVDPDQTPRSAASDLGLHFLPMSHLWDAGLKWVMKQCRNNVEKNNVFSLMTLATFSRTGVGILTEKYTSLTREFSQIMSAAILFYSDFDWSVKFLFKCDRRYSGVYVKRRSEIGCYNTPSSWTYNRYLFATTAVQDAMYNRPYPENTNSETRAPRILKLHAFNGLHTTKKC